MVASALRRVLPPAARLWVFSLVLLLPMTAQAQSLQATYDLNQLPGSATDAADVSVFGKTAADGLGRVVMAADLNGDGVDDLIIGTGTADVGSPVRTDAGAVWIWFGKGLFGGTKDASAATGAAPDVTILGGGENDQLSAGGALGVADVNGDGFGDLIIGSPNADGAGNGRDGAGEAYIILGRAVFPATIDLAASGSASVTVFGGTAGDSLTFGGAIGLGDLNRDGFADLLIGTPLADGPNDVRPSAGEAYVILGRPSFPETLDMGIAGSAGADLTVYGAAASDFVTFGGAITVGDVNGDGFADAILGALGGDGPADARPSAGEAYVLLGRTNLPAKIDLASEDSKADVTIYGASGSDQLTSGGALTTADVNADGISDVLIGAVGGDGPNDARDGAGEAYVVFGRAVFPATIDLSAKNATGANTTLYGATAADNLTAGGALKTSDVNGDGVADIILGASQADGPAEARGNAGEAYVVLGRNDLDGVIDLANQGSGGADVTLYGATAGDNLTIGGALALGDLDGDGKTDVVLGARDADGPQESRSNAGEVYLVLGRASFSGTLDLGVQGDTGTNSTLYGASANDQLTSGGALAFGDVNGDGFADLIVGATAADGPSEARANAGEAYLLFGIGSAVAGPDIAVEQPAGISMADGAARSLGAAVLGATNSRTFTVRNGGTETLNGLAATLNGTNAAEFSLSTTGMETSLAPAATTTFTVTFTPTGAGPRIAAIHLASNDPDENPFDIQITGNGTAPEIRVEQPAGTAIETVHSSVFGDVATNRTATLIFTIKNTGTADLTQLTLNKQGPHPGDFTISALSATTLAPGAGMNCTVTFAPSALGLRSAVLLIGSNDADENPFVIDLGGTGIEPAPEIAIERAIGSNATDGGTESFDTVSIGAPKSLIFTVKNVGTADLTGLAFTLDGAGAGAFSVSPLGTTTLAPDTSTTVTITFDPTARGAHTAAFHLASNDADENPFDIQLSGYSVDPEIAVARQGAPDFNNGASQSFGQVLVGAVWTVNFVVSNRGSDTLSVMLSKSGADAMHYSIAGPTTLAVAPGGNSSVAVTFVPTAVGQRVADLQFLSNDADESPFIVHLSGVAIAPEIALEDASNAIDLTDGNSTRALGDVLLGDGPMRLTFRIRNDGTALLSNLSLSLTGTDASDFSLGSLDAVSLNPGWSTPFEVTFNATNPGSKTATLHVASNDADENPFEVTLSAESIPRAPLFRTPPQSAVVPLGQAVTLAPVITGAAPMTYQWFKNSAAITGAIGATHSFASVKAADAGAYRQLATNADGNITSPRAWLGVVTRGPAALLIKTGGTLTLTCTATMPAGATVLSYLWLRNGDALPANSRTTGTNTKSLKITGLLPADAGNYTCQVTMGTPDGPVAGTNGSTTVTVVEKPTLLPFPLADVFICEEVSVPVLTAHNPTSYTATGLPPGIVLNKATGILTGKPSAAKIVKGAVEPYLVKFTVSNIAGSTTSEQPVPWLVRPLPTEAIGVFNGLVQEHDDLNGRLGGTFNLVTTAKGSCTAKLTLGAASYSASSTLITPQGGGNPTCTLRIPRKAPLTSLIVSGTIDLTASRWTGSVSDAAWHMASIEAWRALNPAGSLARNYTAALLPSGIAFTDETVYPQGEGFALLTVTATGGANWSGKLSDGSVITRSTTLGPNGEIPLHLMLYNGTGSLQGWTQITAANRAWDAAELRWRKSPQPARTVTRSFRNGFPAHALTLAGGDYSKPPASQPVLGLSTATNPNAHLQFFNGGLLGIISQPFTITATNTATVPTNANSVKITSLSATTGLFGGSFVQVDNDPLDQTEPIAVLKRTATFSGVLVPRLGRGAGFFNLAQLPRVAGQTLTNTPILSGCASLGPAP